MGGGGVIEVATEPLALIAKIEFNVADIHNKAGVGIRVYFDKLQTRRVAALFRLAPDHPTDNVFRVLKERKF